MKVLIIRYYFTALLNLLRENNNRVNAYSNEEYACFKDKSLSMVNTKLAELRYSYLATLCSKQKSTKDLTIRVTPARTRIAQHVKANKWYEKNPAMSDNIF
jgi:hypothetical protein